MHIAFLESKGLNWSEIQETLNRVSTNDELVNTNYDPIYMLPTIKYEEFLYKLRQPESSRVMSSFTRYEVEFMTLNESFMNMFSKGLGKSYSSEDKGKMVLNQITLLTEAVMGLYQKAKIKIDANIISECVEKYLMTNLYDYAFTPTEEDAKKDDNLFKKISLLQKFIKIEHLDIEAKYMDETLWTVAQQGKFAQYFVDNQL